MVTEKDIAEIAAIAGEANISVRESDLEAHSLDESWLDAHAPDIVVWPSSTEQVSEIVRYAYDNQIPVVPWSGGSSLEGNPIPVSGGILLALYRMNAILEIREDDLQVVVQPGIVYDALNASLRRLGLFFPPAPGSADVATIGGMVANNSSGMRAVKYGVTRDHVMSMVVVLPSGDTVVLGSQAKKSTSGYDLRSLFVGSEGTLGVATEITLRLVGLPESVGAIVAAFDDLEDATHTVFECVRYGLSPSAVEILDTETIRATNEQQGLSLTPCPTLFVEFDGSETSIAEQIEYLQELCEDNNCASFQEATTAQTREEIWKARQEARDSIKLSNPGKTMLSGDVCVPISRFGEIFAYIREVAERLDLKIYTFGHAGDGNLHTEIIASRENGDEFARAEKATDEIVRRALSLKGTIAGEHGIGLAKRHFMREEHGDTLDVMLAVKHALDPKNIMNPGKVFPAAD